jgi:hypothetical protein
MGKTKEKKLLKIKEKKEKLGHRNKLLDSLKKVSVSLKCYLWCL